MEHFKHSIVESIGQLFHSLLVSFGIAWATFITGLLTWLDIIGERAGQIASLMGAILSFVLIISTIKQHKNKQDLSAHEINRIHLEEEKLQLEIDELRRKQTKSEE